MEEERVEVRTRPRPPPPASQQRAVDEFWRRRQEEIEAMVDFKDRMLPMARLKKVIRAGEEDGMMISADTPAFLSKLCELFVQELAVRAWACAESHNRRIILDADIAEAVASTESYDFLVPVLLQHQREVAAHGGRTAPPAKPKATSRLVTRKRHRPDPYPRRPVRKTPPITPSPPAAPSSVRYVPFPFPCVPLESELHPEDGGMLPVPPINYVTRGRVFFSNGKGTFAGENSAAGMVTSPSLGGSAGELESNVPPAACCFCPYPVIDDSVEAFAVGNTDPTEIPAGNAHGNGDGGEQQRLGKNVSAHRESVVVQQSSNVQDAPAGGLAESPMYILLEEILVDEELLFPDADLFAPASAPPYSEDFIVDQDVLEDVFANPSSSTSSN